MMNKNENLNYSFYSGNILNVLMLAMDEKKDMIKEGLNEDLNNGKAEVEMEINIKKKRLEKPSIEENFIIWYAKDEKSFNNYDDNLELIFRRISDMDSYFESVIGGRIAEFINKINEEEIINEEIIKNIYSSYVGNDLELVKVSVSYY